MAGFDVNRFVHERAGDWRRLEQLLVEVERHGAASLSVAAARELGRLYRSASDDLMRARKELAGAALLDYLNDIVRRAYGVVHVRDGGLDPRNVWDFLLRGFPRTVRSERVALSLAAASLLLGALVGGFFVATDPASVGALLPEDHLVHTPGERIAQEVAAGGAIEGDEAAAFSGYLFTHNIQVTFLVFALGITFGLGTAALLFYNGVPLGALAVQYHMAGHGLFFWAWILPHGIPELTVVVIGGGAGFVLARGQWRPGALRRVDALAVEARTAVSLVLGGAPLLVLAGVVEGTISQMHEPAIAYSTKLLVAGLIGVGVYAYLLGAGRTGASRARGTAQKRSSSLSSSPPESSLSPPRSSS